MSVSIGNKNISQIFIGDKEVQSIYIGNTSIYENYKFQWNFTEDGATLVRYTSGTRTNVKIPGKIGHDGVLYDVIAIGNNAFANTNITSITIPDSVMSIGNEAFNNCTSLTSVYYTGDIASWCGISFGYYGANPLEYAHNLYINNTLVTEITIPDTVTEIKRYAFLGWNGMSIIIPDSVRSIGSSAFSGCSSLTSVTISDGVTSIGVNAFRNCTSLTSVTIPDSVTSIGDYAFRGCSSLTSVTIGIGVTNIGSSAFNGCTSLATITYSGSLLRWNSISKGASWNTNTGDYVIICTDASIDKQNVKYTLSNNEYAVTGYSWAPTSISIKATIGGNSVTSIGNNAFYNCSSLTSVTIPDSVTSIGNYAFTNCQSLTSVTIPDSVMSIGSSAFTGCPIETASIPAIACSYIKNSSLETVIITSGTSIVDYAFYNCSSLTSVTIPDSVASIGEQAFQFCGSLTSITIGNGVTSIGYNAFDSCLNLTSVYYNGSIASWCGVSFDGSDANPLSYAHNLYINNTLVTEITIPDTVTEIKAYAFRGWNGTSITIPYSVTGIGNAAFFGCSSLATITYNGTLSQWNDIIKGTNWDNSAGNYVVICTVDSKALDKQGVTYELSNNEYEVTSYNGSGSYVDIRPLIATYSVTSISASVFENKTSLTKIGIPSSISAIGASALSGCSGLQEIIYSGTLSQWNSITKGTGWDTGTGDYVLVCLGSDIAFDKHGITYTLTQGAYHASSYSGSKGDIIIKGAINDINVTTINPEVFMDNTTITSVTIPGNVQTIGENSFQGCTNLTTVNLNEGTQVIGEGAFVGCSALSTIYISDPQLNTLPSTMSSIGSYAFSQCVALANLVIPSGVDSIPEGMMSGCTNFRNISLPSTITSIGRWAFNVTSLEKIQYAGAVNSWLNITKGSEWDPQTNNYTVICTDGYIRNNGVIYKPTTGGLYVYGYIGTSTPQPVSVDVESSVDSISVISIGEGAFDNKNISEITLPSTITSVGANAFRNCPIIFAHIPTIAISSIPKSALQTVVIDGGSSIGDYAFYNCSSLTSITIPDSVTSIGVYAFYNCSSLTSVFYTGDIDSWCGISFDNVTSNPLKYAHNLYINNIRMTEITIPDTITGIKANAFCGWNGTSVTIGSGVMSIGGCAFYECSSLTSVTIPDNVTSIGNSAFAGCSGLTSTTIGNSVTSIGNQAFYNCSSLTSVFYTGDIASWCGISFDGYYANPLCYAHNLYIDNIRMTEITIPDTITEIKRYAFFGWNGMSVIIPNSVTNIGSSAFNGCTSLATITYNGTLSQWNGITKGSGWDANTGDYVVICTDASIDKQGVIYTLSNNEYAVTGYSGSPTSISIRDIIGGKNVKSVGQNVFQNCTSLTSVTIPDSVTSIGHYAFEKCSSLTSVTIGSGVTSIGWYAFRGCTPLTTITYNGTLSQWNGITKGTGWNTNTGDYVVICTDVSIDRQGVKYKLSNNEYEVTGYSGSPTSISIKATIGGKNVTSIGQYAFEDCSSLTSATIPSSVTSIGSRAFQKCNLTSITIPDDVTIIRYRVFERCTHLESITIGSKVTSIGEEAFSYCSSLTSITFRGTKVQWNAISKGSKWNYNTGSYTIHCTDGDISK